MHSPTRGGCCPAPTPGSPTSRSWTPSLISVLSSPWLPNHPGPCYVTPSSQAEIRAPAGLRVTPRGFLLSPLLCPGHRRKTRAPQEVDKPCREARASFLSELSLLHLERAVRGCKQLAGPSWLNLARGGGGTHPDLQSREFPRHSPALLPSDLLSHSGTVHPLTLTNLTPVQAPDQSDNAFA